MSRNRACLIAPALAVTAALSLTACAYEQDTTAQQDTTAAPQVAGDPILDLPPTVETNPLSEVRVLRARLRAMDEDNDGFIGRQEAESFWRWRFGRLDDNGDGRLSAAELHMEYPGVPDPDIAHDSLVGVTRESYFEIVGRDFDQRANPTTGMMTTADFEEMVRNTDPAVNRQGRPMVGPEPLE